MPAKPRKLTYNPLEMLVSGDAGEPAGPITFHASSAVKLRNGAIQRSIAWAMRPRAVCAERRACEAGAVV